MARIEPTSAAWTTLTSPSCSAKSAMKSSGRLPSADWTTLAPPEPSRAPSCSVAVPTRRASAASAAAATRNVTTSFSPAKWQIPARTTASAVMAISMRSRLVRRRNLPGGSAGPSPIGGGDSPVSCRYLNRPVSSPRGSLVAARPARPHARPRRFGPRLDRDRVGADRPQREPASPSASTPRARRCSRTRPPASRSTCSSGARSNAIAPTRSTAAAVVQARLLGRVRQVQAGLLEDASRAPARPTTDRRSPGR